MKCFLCGGFNSNVLQGVEWCCRVLQGVAGCCRVLQGVAGCCRALHGVAESCNVLHGLHTNLPFHGYQVHNLIKSAPLLEVLALPSVLPFDGIHNATKEVSLSLSLFCSRALSLALSLSLSLSRSLSLCLSLQLCTCTYESICLCVCVDMRVGVCQVMFGSVEQCMLLCDACVHDARCTV